MTERTVNKFHKELNTDNHLTSLSNNDLISIIKFQNQRLVDLNFKLGHAENLLERIFRLNLLKQSKLKLDMCTYMSSKKGATNGEKRSEVSKENYKGNNKNQSITH